MFGIVRLLRKIYKLNARLAAAEKDHKTWITNQARWNADLSSRLERLEAIACDALPELRRVIKRVVRYRVSIESRRVADAELIDALGSLVRGLRRGIEAQDAATDRSTPDGRFLLTTEDEDQRVRKDLRSAGLTISQSEKGAKAINKAGVGADDLPRPKTAMQDEADSIKKDNIRAD